MKKLINTVLQLLIFFFAWVLLIGVMPIPFKDPVLWRLAAEAEPLILLLALTAMFLRFNRGTVHIPVREHAGRALASGTLSGILWIGLSAGILLFSKQIVITGKNEVDRLWIWILAVFLNVIMQELLIHGFIYEFLKARYNLPAAVVVTAALFTFMHGGAFEAGVVPVLNVATMCLFMTALYEAEGSLIAPILPHAIWNVTAAILLGMDSLADDYPSVCTAKASANVLISGGKFKLAGSIVVLFLNIVFGLVFLWICVLRRKEVERTD